MEMKVRLAVMFSPVRACLLLCLHHSIPDTYNLTMTNIFTTAGILLSLCYGMCMCGLTTRIFLFRFLILKIILRAALRASTK